MRFKVKPEYVEARRVEPQERVNTEDLKDWVCLGGEWLVTHTLNPDECYGQTHASYLMDDEQFEAQYEALNENTVVPSDEEMVDMEAMAWANPSRNDISHSYIVKLITAVKITKLALKNFVYHTANRNAERLGRPTPISPAGLVGMEDSWIKHAAEQLAADPSTKTELGPTRKELEVALDRACQLLNGLNIDPISTSEAEYKRYFLDEDFHKCIDALEAKS